MRRAPLCIALLLVVGLAARRASASASARLVYVRSQASARCPDEEALRRAVRARVGYDPFSPAARTTLVVEVASSGETFTARVQIVDEHGLSLGVRELESATKGCAGLLDAAALAISIALESNALPSATTRATPQEVATPEVTASVRGPAPPAPSASLAPASPEEAGAPETSVPAPSASTASPVPIPSLAVAAGIDALSVVNDAPEVVGALNLWVAVRRGLGSAAVELRADTPSTISFARDAQATLLVLAANLVPCVHAGPFFGCAVAGLEWLQATGSHVLVARSGSALALAFGPRLGFEWELARSFGVRVLGALSVNALRPAVSLDAASWRLPAIGGEAGAGIAYRFP